MGGEGPARCVPASGPVERHGAGKKHRAAPDHTTTPDPATWPDETIPPLVLTFKVRA